MDTRISRTKIETKKIKQKRFNILKLLVFILFIYLIVCLGIYLFDQPIKHYEIVGNNYLSDADILRELELTDYPAITKVKLSKLEQKLKNNIYVNDVDIKYGWNYTIKINIEENRPMFYMRDTNQLVLSNGEIVDNQVDNMNLPILLNNTPVKIISKLATKLAYVDAGILSMISEIEYQPSYSLDGTLIDEARFLIYMNDGNLVYITAKNAALLNNYLKVISTSLIGGAGTLYLDGKEERYTFILFDENDLIERKKKEITDISDDGSGQYEG